MQGKANYTNTTQSTGGRGPLQYKCVINQGQPTNRVQYSIPTCLQHEKAKGPGKHTQEMNRNPYSLMHGNNKYKKRWDRTTQRKREDRRGKGEEVHISYGVASGLHLKVLEQQASVSRH